MVREPPPFDLLMSQCRKGDGYAAISAAFAAWFYPTSHISILVYGSLCIHTLCWGVRSLCEWVGIDQPPPCSLQQPGAGLEDNVQVMRVLSGQADPMYTLSGTLVVHWASYCGTVIVSLTGPPIHPCSVVTRRSQVACTGLIPWSK